MAIPLLHVSALHSSVQFKDSPQPLTPPQLTRLATAMPTIHLSEHSSRPYGATNNSFDGRVRFESLTNETRLREPWGSCAARRLLIMHREVKRVVWAPGTASSHAKLQWLFRPALRSIEQGLRELTATSTRKWTINVEHNGSQCDELRRHTSNMNECDIFIHIGALQCPERLAEMTAQRVTTVFYETEPVQWYDPCRYGAGKVSEIWHYSMGSMNQACRGVKLRYVPPGYDKELDVLDSSDCTSHNKLVFFSGVSDHDREVWMQAVNRSFAADSHMQVHVESSVWDQSAMNSLLKHHCRFANLHKTSHRQFEAFRAAELLSSGSMLISTRSEPGDEDVYKGLVTFIDTPSDMAGKAANHSWSGKEIRDAFRSRFDAATLLRQAQVHELL